MKIFDLILFNGEDRLLLERINAINAYVDAFYILEFGRSFSGVKKNQVFTPALIPRSLRKKVHYLFIDELVIYDRETIWRTDFTRSLPWKHSGRPAIELVSSLKREINQRDTLYRLIEQKIAADDVIIVSDADEIPSPDFFTDLNLLEASEVAYAEMDWRIYYTDLRCVQPWYGTYAARASVFQHFSVDELRVASCLKPVAVEGLGMKIVKNGGVHLSYLGGLSEIKRKLRYHPYQGLRAEFSKLLIFGLPKLGSMLLASGYDILLQNRKLEAAGLNTPSLEHISMSLKKDFSHDNIL